MILVDVLQLNLFFHQTKRNRSPPIPPDDQTPRLLVPILATGILLH